MADLGNPQTDIHLPPEPSVVHEHLGKAPPDYSKTTRHHRLSRDGSKQHAVFAIPNSNLNRNTHSNSSKVQLEIPRRKSSGESNETGCSDPRQWFDQSNLNSGDIFDGGAMDVDPPFFQKESNSSIEETQNAVPVQSPGYPPVQNRVPAFHANFAKSNSADDFRSVIDDLTIENKRLREELRKLKPAGPDFLRRDKLFEVRIHGLSSTKRRELEAALREFTTNLPESSAGIFTNRKKPSGKPKEGHSSTSKHASSSSGSNSRPVDSAYASMGTGKSSSSHPPPGQTRAARLRSKQNIENYLRDIPAGLWPRATVMTDHEKKKLVVKRLEHLFTGKMGHSADRAASVRQPEPIAEDIEMEDDGIKALPVKPREAAREAKIRTADMQQKMSRSRTTISASMSNVRTHTQSQSHSNSQSNADLSNPRDNDKDSGSGNGEGGVSGRGGKDVTPQESVQPSEQRPTRPRDLDPDRKQVPADNMEYIRHLGIVAPESQRQFSSRDVSPDADGWVYLNLLGNLAQLHILNVTSDFIRSAVSERSAKFQLSPDGRKIRWRGGDEGTRFTSDSGSNSRDRSSDDTDGSNEHGRRKKLKGTKFNLGVQNSHPSHSFHYTPLFIHHPTSYPDESASLGDVSGLSNEQSEETNLWDQGGSLTALSQRKRRRDGAIIYYSGAPFCTDLSGDYDEVSLDTYDMTSWGEQLLQDPAQLHLVHRPSSNHQSVSGSSIPSKPLSESVWCSTMMGLNRSADVGSTTDDTEDCLEAQFPWSDSKQEARFAYLEASGLGGVYPDDHFLVVVSTRRPKDSELNYNGNEINGGYEIGDRSNDIELPAQGNTDVIVSEAVSMSTPSPAAGSTAKHRDLAIAIEYVSNKIHRLSPVPLPPPAFYFPSGDSDSDENDNNTSLEEEDNTVSSERSILSKRPMLAGSPDSDNRELSGNDEEDEHSEDGPNSDLSINMSYGRMRRRSGIKSDDGPSMRPLSRMSTGSSAATAGGAASGDYSSVEDA
ncbi:frequency clock protein [Xylaria nigripes]|nr:frequency clock protein [Xylaria nigripes]